MASKRLTPNPVVPKEQAEIILKPYFPRFLDCIEKAWAAWKGEEYAVVRHQHAARSRANIIHDRMVNFAKHYFDSDPAVHIVTKNGRVMANVEDKFVARFKKLDSKKRSRGIPTKQSLLFKAQIDFDGIPSALTHVDVGYVLNDLQTELEGAYIICPNAKGIEWVIDLKASATGKGSGEVFNLPQGPTDGSDQSQSNESQGKRFKVRSDGRDKGASEGEGGDQS